MSDPAGRPYAGPQQYMRAGLLVVSSVLLVLGRPVPAVAQTMCTTSSPAVTGVTDAGADLVSDVCAQRAGRVCPGRLSGTGRDDQPDLAGSPAELCHYGWGRAASGQPGRTASSLHPDRGAGESQSRLLPEWHWRHLRLGV